MKTNHIKKFFPSVNELKAHFGVDLRKLGFVSYNRGKEWYALKNGKIFFSLLFVCNSVECNIYLRIQPLSTHMVYPFERYNGAKYEQRNNSISALGYYLWSNLKNGNDISSFPRSTQDTVKKNIEVLRILFDEVVVYLFNSINDFSDVINIQFINQYDHSVFAYLTGDADAFYNNSFSQFPYSRITKESSHLLPIDASMREYGKSVSLGVINGDMTVVGKHLQLCEVSNVVKLKELLPSLFKTGNCYIPLSDDFIVTHAVTEVRKPISYQQSYDKDDVRLEYEPVPDVSANLNVSFEESLKSLKSAIAKHFYHELSALGFISRNDGMEWHKIVDNCLYQRIYFSLHPTLFSVSVFYETRMLSDEIVINADYEESMASNSASHKLFELLGMPYIHQVYSNPFDSGDVVYAWQIRRLKRLLRYVVFPYMEQTKTIIGLCDAVPNCLSAICYLKKYELVDEEMAERYRENAIIQEEYYGVSLEKRPYRISNKGHCWSTERTRVLYTSFYHNDMDYLRNYFLKCQEYNLAFLREKIPALFEK